MSESYLEEVYLEMTYLSNARRLARAHSSPSFSSSATKLAKVGLVLCTTPRVKSTPYLHVATIDEGPVKYGVQSYLNLQRLGEDVNEYKWCPP